MGAPLRATTPPPYPGFPAQPPPHPGFPPPPPPPPRRSHTALFVGLGGGAFALLLVCALLGVFLVHTVGDEPDTPPLDPHVARQVAAANDLAAAAVTVSGVPGARYTGWFTGDGGDRITLDAQVTTEGSTLARLDVNGQRIQALDTGERTFVRAAAAYWRGMGVRADVVKEYGRQWVQVADDHFGFDLGDSLAPSTLAEVLAGDGTTDLPVPGPTTTIDGVPVQVVDVGGLEIHVTTTEPRQVVRVAARADTGPQVTGTRNDHRSGRVRLITRGTQADDEFELNFGRLTPEETEEFFRTLTARVQELRNAVDSQVSFTLNGAITLSPCTVNGCRANVTLSNRVTSTSPYLSVDRPVTASITTSMTLDGRPVATCTTTKSMRPNGSVTTSCFARYRIPPSRNPKVHTVRAQASTVARAVVQADIKALADDLARELIRNRRLRATPTPAPAGTAPNAPTATARPQATRSAMVFPTATSPSLTPAQQQAKARVEQLAKQACREVARQPHHTAATWGTAVHSRLAELIEAEGGNLHSEVSYLRGRLAPMRYNPYFGRKVWPAGSARADVVVGADPLKPEFFLDLKTGDEGLKQDWYDKLHRNLPAQYRNRQLPVFEVRC
ncbi:hypothetical protein OG777_06050 [Micromonospora peucetia]|uniref:hypothetical protein n=1 Tax=Micromonospora peucetia TaxID=47871 RepID=UPI002257F3E2|nr:hypothetical protein [Micromonospora peucetia]MCX4386491.1 hypothetical protein [Micromonospora peucetia]